MNLEEEFSKIAARNRKVELDKAWETSWFRRVIISVFTYIVAFVWIYTIHDPNAALKALVPVAGFLLSTITIAPLKQWWIQKNALLKDQESMKE